MHMVGLICVVLVCIGVVLMVRSLRLVGCLSFVVWLLVGMAVMWVLLEWIASSRGGGLG